MSTPTPLACVPGAIAPEHRAAHFALAARLFGGATLRERRPAESGDGYAFRFDAGELEAVARFVANERRCCPFLRFTIELVPDEGESDALWLRLTGPAGTREFLDAELGPR